MLLHICVSVKLSCDRCKIFVCVLWVKGRGLSLSKYMMVKECLNTDTWKGGLIISFMYSPVGPSFIQKSVTSVTICRLEELIDAAAAELNIFAGKIMWHAVELQQPKGVAGGLPRDAAGDQVHPVSTKAASYQNRERLYVLCMREDSWSLWNTEQFPTWRIRRWAAGIPMLYNFGISHLKT